MVTASVARSKDSEASDSLGGVSPEDQLDGTSSPETDSSTICDTTAEACPLAVGVLAPLDAMDSAEDSSASTCCVDAASTTDSLSEASSPSDDLLVHPTTSSPITLADELSVLSLEAVQDASEGDVNDALWGDDSASADAELLAEIAKDGLPLSLSAGQMPHNSFLYKIRQF